MATNKLVNILGGGLLCASVVLLFFWAFFSPWQFAEDAIFFGVRIESYFLMAILSLLSGFILAILTPNEEVERHYLRYGLFLGIVITILAAGNAAWEVKKLAEVSMPLRGSTYIFPSLSQVFLTNLAVDVLLLIMATLISSIGYGIGNLVKGLFRPSKT